ncbi:HupE/UreJ family protein [Paucibacter sp. R3-3]|uniref:HupE/UreJ family protein n=1 Tax=Roseateles agri TaxID=3098619 RepID=A0ABU5DL67_9BURK|nr:HupE/UreJ family protein [Paucibacter sp. R3-3]MDY0747036.1 HupE/UreJ family protein [Paucibacter sp. R3-3]
MGGLAWRMAALVMALLLLPFDLVHAHDVPPSLVMLDIGRDAVDAELQLPLPDLGAALQLPLAAQPDQVLARYSAPIEQRVREAFALRSFDDRAYRMELGPLALRRTDNPNWTANRWVVVHARLTAPAGASTLAFTVEDRIISERVVSHNALVSVRHDIRNGVLGDAPVQVGMLGFGIPALRIDGSAGGWMQGLVHLLRLGMRHIAEGPDHLLFLLALLLPAPLLARAGRWCGVRPVREALRGVVLVVSGFTIGHSASLALATLGWVEAPTAAVELLIAVSIVVSCVHAWRPVFAGRELWVAAGFGLVHGLAFAETLAGLDFDATTLGLSLLGFNVGIELMQLIVVATLLPTFLWLARSRWSAVTRLAGAGFAAACACGWVIERGLHRPNPLQALADGLSPPPAWLAALLVMAGAAAALALWCGGAQATAARPDSTAPSSVAG